MKQTLEESFSTVYLYSVNIIVITLICCYFCLASLQYNYGKIMCKLTSDTCSNEPITEILFF